MGSLAYVQVLYKLVSLQDRLEPCLLAVGEGDTELGWIQESRFVSALVKFRHGAFVLCSLLQSVTAVVFVESDLVLLVEQVTSSARLANEQVFNLEAVEAEDDRPQLITCSRLGCKASMGTIELRW